MVKDTQSRFRKEHIIFEMFLANTTQKKEATKTFIDLSKKFKNKEIKILDIGAGSGVGVIEFLRELNKDKKFKNKFQYFYLDPSKEEYNVFLKKINSYDLGKYVKDCCLVKWEDFNKEIKFDFIISSHAWYYIKSWKKMLKKVYDYLYKGGIACITIQSKESDNFKFRKFFFPKIGYGEYEESGDKICSTLDKLKISYSHKIITSITNMTSCIKNNKPINKEGERLLSFLLRTNYSKLSDEIKSEINQYLKTHTSKIDANKVFKFRDSYIIIHKT